MTERECMNMNEELVSGYGIVSEIRKEINRVFVGKEQLVDDLIMCFFAGGHVLLEDVPGVGKSTLASTVSRTTGCSFGRIQFTPDTLPGDIVGISVYNNKNGKFEYQKGVVMNQIVMADEINRTAPKTQSSLLEAMAEGKVTVDGKEYALPQPFMVIATQNPIEYLGTYPLPEAQMDRFMMRLSIGYPKREDEITMAKKALCGENISTLQNVCSAEEILAIRGLVDKVMISDAVLEYIEDIVCLTREEKSFLYGASPRALLALVKASQARAFMEQRDFVKPDDVKAVAIKVLEHRLKITSEAKVKKITANSILKGILVKAKIPV